ncbi:MAG TPA: hypothetical protein VGE77_03080, partial [Nocardioides sp.]
MARARPSADPGAATLPRATLDALTTLLAAAPARLGAGRLVCIDGPSGSGKTTAADALAARLAAGGHHDVVTLHMDDQYDGWDGLGAAPGRVAHAVLAPLAAGGAGRYRRYDWHAGRFAEEHVVPPVGPRTLVLLEGVGSGAAPLAPYRSVL